MQVLWNNIVKFVSVSQLLGSALCSLFGSVSGPFSAPDLSVSLGGKKEKTKTKEPKMPPVEFKPARRVLLVFLDAAG